MSERKNTGEGLNNKIMKTYWNFLKPEIKVKTQ